MDRFSSGKPINISVDAAGNINTAGAEAIPFGSFAGGAIITGTGLTSLAPYGAMEQTGPYVPIHDKDDVAVAMPVTADKGYAFPEECYGWRFLKFAGNAVGSIQVHLKS